MLLRLNGTQNCRTFHKSLKQWRSPTSSPPTSLRCFAATGWRALYISCEAAKADVAAQGRYAKPILGEGKRKTDDGGRTMCLPSYLRHPSYRVALDGFFQFLRGAEGDFLVCLDLNGLAGSRIAAHARGAFAHLQNAEAADADALALFQVLDDLSDHTAENGFCLLFRKFIVFRKARREMLQCNGCGRFGCHWFGCHLDPPR